MARHDEAIVAERIQSDGLVPLFFHADRQVCRAVAKAVFDAGCSALEFTNRGPGALEAFSDLVAFAREAYPSALVGVGSIIDARTAAQFMELDADFVVGPGFDEGVAQFCQRQNVLYVPGCATVTEILTARKSGAELIKLFPADALGGPEFVRALMGPLPWLKLVATGGVRATNDSLQQWFDAGVSAVGLGSDLISGERITRGDYAGLEQQLTELLAWVRRFRFEGRSA